MAIDQLWDSPRSQYKFALEQWHWPEDRQGGQHAVMSNGPFYSQWKGADWQTIHSPSRCWRVGGLRIRAEKDQLLHSPGCNTEGIVSLCIMHEVLRYPLIVWILVFVYQCRKLALPAVTDLGFILRNTSSVIFCMNLRDYLHASW